MYAKVIAVAVAFAAFVVATPIPGGEGSCNTGPVQCCNSVQQVNNQNQGLLAALVGLDVSQVTGMVGLGCTPISVIGLSGNSCSGQTVCCSHNNFNAVVGVGCSPINLNA
ncbi:hypothetical protein AMATHDRAFT_49815 [Amanita thiersii Skay4041]|uniref:Hydrophobin n=1 Tax=Amanita thiersii Skay4041 TaxID=703135 RepID=A0A2A9NFG6_9AGAR|nr:hypothetical protein AMATHDRAFT_49815 [Amanita thiersii Skay4041]